MCNVGIGIFIPKKIMKFECTETMSISWNNEAILFVQNNSMLKFGLKSGITNFKMKIVKTAVRLGKEEIIWRTTLSVYISGILARRQLSVQKYEHITGPHKEDTSQEGVCIKVIGGCGEDPTNNVIKVYHLI